MPVGTVPTTPQEQRRAAMALCAEAKPEELRAALDAVAYRGAVETLRPAETGLVMARARIGGDGSPFNLGEATVTRAAVRIASGEAGFAWHLGRDAARAEAAALLDALWQVPTLRPTVEAVLVPVAQRLEAEAAREARHTAATRVEFFTMVRGEG
ncbi:phosphonate C-P lyase system protein PhnG [Roseicella aquatilis]|uniref:Phosphonate C-P lyase system protein PhnG n=1 Tax=Roseicella aquatilis TaxID=2527868 RepID=A0A4R4DW94_9PROT|nr:phosphonate C-P lyase system protein PhnG [Roseicella aquatilis]TCZ64961.1 phosphonate C-P lyase system protein PhnG [Roseicella aquatilis]